MINKVFFALHRHSVLLACILLLFSLTPVVNELGNFYFLRVILISLVVLSSLYAVEQKNLFTFTAILGVAIILLESFLFFFDYKIGEFFAFLIEISFFSSITILLVKRLYEETDVRYETIFGAINVYFLLGIIWAFIYQGIEFYMPGAFSTSFYNLEHKEFAEKAKVDLFYFSFVTMSTLGYGDITPVNSVAKSFAVLQGILGQFYIAVVVAKLVASSVSKENKGSSA